MGLNFDKIRSFDPFGFHVSDEGNGCWRANIVEFEHFEHPVWNYAGPLFSQELEDSAVSKPRTILNTENHGFIGPCQHMRELIQG